MFYTLLLIATVFCCWDAFDSRDVVPIAYIPVWFYFLSAVFRNPLKLNDDWMDIVYGSYCMGLLGVVIMDRDFAFYGWASFWWFLLFGASVYTFLSMRNYLALRSVK